MNPIEIRTIATKYALEQIEVQKKEFKRWGVLGDWDNGYKTMGKPKQPGYDSANLILYFRAEIRSETNWNICKNG